VVRAAEVAVAVTLVLDEEAFITRQSATRLMDWAALWMAANFVLSAW